MILLLFNLAASEMTGTMTMTDRRESKQYFWSDGVSSEDESMREAMIYNIFITTLKRSESSFEEVFSVEMNLAVGSDT